MQNFNIGDLFFEQSAKAAEAANPRQPGDYKGEDGLLYCVKCHTPKQYRIPAGEYTGQFGGRIVYCACECVREKQKQEAEAAEAAQHRERVQDLKRRCFDVRAMEDCTFDHDSGNVPVMEAARKYVENFNEGENFEKAGRGLLLWGYPGTGKSYAAAAICNALCEKGISCRFIGVGKMIADLSSFGRNHPDRTEYYNELNRARLLVIDDLGADRGTEFTSELVFGLIDLRWQCRLPMIITTNQTIEQIKEAGELAKSRINSRIIEFCYPIEVKGQDQRMAAAVQKYYETRKVLGM